MQVWAATFDVDSIAELEDEGLKLLDHDARTKVERFYQRIDSFSKRIGRLFADQDPIARARHSSALDDVRDHSGAQAVHRLNEPIGYNITHDNGVIAMAFASGSDLHPDPPAYRIGVDVMKLSLPRRTTYAGFVETVGDQLTGLEQRTLLPEPPLESSEALRRFYLIWTLKEAYTKALGLGLGFDFKRIEYDVPNDVVRIDGVRPVGWEFVRFDINRSDQDTYVGVVARYVGEKDTGEGECKVERRPPGEWLKVYDAAHCVAATVATAVADACARDYSRSIKRDRCASAACWVAQVFFVSTNQDTTQSITSVAYRQLTRQNAATCGLEIAEDLCRRRRPYEALPYLDKAMRDPRNLDAWVQAAFLAPTLDDSTQLLECAEKQGRKLLQKDLGSDCFDDDGDCVGRFWSVLETRPYMRVLQALVRIHVENAQYGKAADVCIEMLRLCPGDNMGQRDWLGALLARAGRCTEALSYSQAWLEDSTSHPDGKAPPSQTPLTPEHIERLSRFTKADIPYSAALAAFKLWGNCELARQYLLIGARLNSQVLLKILAKIDRPKSLSNAARELNSTEDAHDYLWLAQDAWMEEDVWKWANDQQDAKACVMKPCSRDGCDAVEQKVAQFKRCGACHQVWYCSTACQKQDWKKHKPACKQREQMKQFMRSIALGKPAKTPAPFTGAAADFAEGGMSSRWF
ncbi:hypothetical protein NM688_g2741 [Phlebia brevispora]|uniref:Uncharacterized protein n=1 Tax=Phlebia brevispora TaxID=194682 RepID=A0ACC1T7Z5_9APHY|nr:hypothetical protein NM688_g2741 [Phlebia brevispora]